MWFLFLRWCDIHSAGNPWKVSLRVPRARRLVPETSVEETGKWPTQGLGRFLLRNISEGYEWENEVLMGMGVGWGGGVPECSVHVHCDCARESWLQFTHVFHLYTLLRLHCSFMYMDPVSTLYSRLERLKYWHDWWKLQASFLVQSSLSWWPLSTEATLSVAINLCHYYYQCIYFSLSPKATYLWPQFPGK